MSVTRLSEEDILPLTCTREGTCCYQKQVWINPWELNMLAWARGLSVSAFRTQHTDAGGIRLRFQASGKRMCSQLDPKQGCLAYLGRPLACRLYPLGRQLQGDTLTYVHPGKRLPCLDACPSVTHLPRMTVAQYLATQEIDAPVLAQDAYLELAQSLGEAAFELLLETPLAASGDRHTLRRWATLGNMSADARAQTLPAPLLAVLTEGSSLHLPLEQEAFIQDHQERIQEALQPLLNTEQPLSALSQASSTLMGLALQLAQSVGADVSALCQRWIATAEQHGARR